MRIHPEVLCEAVRDVALEADARRPNTAGDARSVKQREWNSARRLLATTYGALPQANEVCRQLSDRDGKPFPWRDLLELVLDDRRSVRKTLDERRSEPDRIIGPEIVRLALRRVAMRLEVRTLRPDDYERGRGAILERMSGRRALALRRQLPTVGQIEVACDGGWDGALAIAGLDRREAVVPRARAPVSLADGITLFYARHGFLPTHRQLDEFAQAGSFALRSKSAGPWADAIRDGTERIRELGLPDPPRYGHSPRHRWNPSSSRSESCRRGGRRGIRGPRFSKPSSRFLHSCRLGPLRPISSGVRSRAAGGLRSA